MPSSYSYGIELEPEKRQNNYVMSSKGGLYLQHDINWIKR